MFPHFIGAVETLCTLGVLAAVGVQLLHEQVVRAPLAIGLALAVAPARTVAAFVAFDLVTSGSVRSDVPAEVLDDCCARLLAQVAVEVRHTCPIS